MHPTLRPLNVGEILDRSFSLYRAQFAPLLATGLALHTPVALLHLLNGWLMSRGGAGATDSELVLSFTGPAVTCLLTGALTYQAGRAYMGEPSGVGAAIRHGAARFLPLAVALVLTTIGIVLGAFGFLIGAALVWVLLFAVVPAVVIERRGPLAAIQRSTALAEGDWLRIFAVMAVVFIVAVLPSLSLQVVALYGAESDSPMRIGIFGAVDAMVQVATLPLSMAATVILYYDRRVRAEALDLQLATGALSPTAV